ncbi:hypothetical protein OMAG_000312 [Candidatus Omnitrophus magneticus]|uniref:Uncharacterized protein n=1 Tax=Candidatus Omnitrophus magneticus TaxID=1609969 RepID=A0A0F0CRD9_9BACT|nr:hypothetical protein OMAG_000312 [Candidatus Omnitrophus magneticus]
MEETVLEDMHLGQIHSVIGTVKKVRDLLVSAGIRDIDKFDAKTWEVPIINTTVKQFKLIVEYLKKTYEAGKLGAGGIEIYFDLLQNEEMKDMNLGQMHSVIGQGEKVRELLVRSGARGGQQFNAEKWEVPIINATAKQFKLIVEYLKKSYEAGKLGAGGIEIYFDLLQNEEMKDMNLGQMHSVIGQGEKVKELLVRSGARGVQQFNAEKWDVPKIDVTAKQLKLISEYLKESFQKETVVSDVKIYSELRAFKDGELKGMNLAQIYSVIGIREKIAAILKNDGMDIDTDYVKGVLSGWDVPFCGNEEDLARRINDMNKAVRTITKKSPGTSDLSEEDVTKILQDIHAKLKNNIAPQELREYAAVSNLLEIIETTKQANAPPKFVIGLLGTIKNALLEIAIVPESRISFARPDKGKDIYAITEKIGNRYVIYITSGLVEYIQTNQKNNIISQVLAHEYAENILGAEHKLACKFELCFSRNKSFSELTALSIDTARVEDIEYLRSIKKKHPADKDKEFYKYVQNKLKVLEIEEKSFRPKESVKQKTRTRQSSQTITPIRALEETLRYIYDENQKKDAKGEPIRPCGIHLEELAEQHEIISGSVLIKMLIDNKDELGLGIKAHKGKISINQRKIYEIVKDAIGKAIIPKSGFNAAYDNVLTIRDSLLKYYREDRLRGGVEIYFYLMKEEGLLEMNLGQIHTVIGTGRKVKELLKSSGIIDSNNVDEKNWNVPIINTTVDQVKCIAEYLKIRYESNSLGIGGIEIYFDLIKEEKLKEMHLGHIHSVIGQGEKVKVLLERFGVKNVELFNAKNWDVPYINATVEQVKCIAEYFLKRIYEENSLGIGGIDIYFDLIKEEKLKGMHLGQIHSVIGQGEKVKVLLERFGVKNVETFDEKKWNVPVIDVTVEQVKCIAEHLKGRYEKDSLGIGGIDIYFDLIKEEKLKGMHLGQIHSVIGQGEKVKVLLERFGVKNVETFDEKKWNVPVIDVTVEQLRVSVEYIIEVFSKKMAVFDARIYS